jgi:hypothetical protein
MPTERRLIKVYIDQDYLIQLMTTGANISATVIEGIPADATLITSNFDHERYAAYFIFQHESFPLVCIGCEIPVMNIKVQHGN